VLVEQADGSALVTQDGTELGLVRPVKHGAKKGQWEFESYLALAEARRGYAPSRAGALYHLGFKVLAKGSGAICFEAEEGKAP
jgi:hypothetical protein